MRRPFVMTISALAIACCQRQFSPRRPLPSSRRNPPPLRRRPPRQLRRRLPFTTPAGLLLVQIKPDQTAVFEEMVGKLKAGLAKTEDATLKQQASGIKVYKVTEPFNNNVLYLVMVEPSVPSAEYELFAMLQKVMTKEELSAPDMAENWKRFAAAFGAGLSKLSLTPVQ